MARRQRRSHRSGVVLLVILSLLVLFALLGVTFVIVSGQYKRSASAFARTETYGDDWARQLDTAMYTSVRDTHDSASPLRGHSLLLDLYGHDTYAGRVTAASVTSGFGGGQLIDVQCTLSYVPDNTQPVPQDAGYFNGCVLTFSRPLSATTTSQLAGNSVRIVGSAYDTASSTYTLRIMRPTPDNSSVSTVPVQGDMFVINGRPFAGSGAGYDLTSGKLDMSLVAQPNRAGQDLNSYLRYGANENWDAADLQNLFLAAVIPDESHPTGIRHYSAGGNSYPSILPSFHRPALIQYGGGTQTQLNTFRPIPGVNASSNFPALADPINGPWDVDNDGDGVADSIWIDLNFPVQTTPGGLRYKPLFAFHIVDMDGRLNLNFQGNQQHYGAIAALDPNRFMADGSTTQAWPIKGHGAGPAEVVLGNTDTTNPVGLFGFANYQQLLQLRWASDGLPGDGSVINATNDPISVTKFFEIPGNYAPGGNSAYASPPDLRGQLAVGVDRRGQLIMDRPTDTMTDFRQEAAYRTWMSKDRRFTPTELERILRYYDIDAAQLPTRLETVAGVLSNSTGLTAAQRQMVAVNRRIVTTESYDMPVATATNTTNTGRDNRRDPMALLRRRFPGTAGDPTYERQLLDLVDRDFYFGLKMNINRPLGDGQDSNNNGVIDEPQPDEITPAYNSGNGFHGANGLDLDGDGMKDPQAELLVRHQLAKHLYVLASLCCDTGSVPNPNVQRNLAQWAVNVVDFRDADSIMTPFEYDPNPFDGWNPQCDGILNPGEPVNALRGLVWGCERPELLLTETLAFHDTRTTDTDNEDPVDPMGSTAALVTAAMNPDTDFDQRYLPEGGAFIELYAPWQGAEERRPAEFYNHPTTGGILLNKKDMTTDTSPVWRMLVVKQEGQTIDPDTQVPADRATFVMNVERSVYFTDPAGLADTEDGTRYFPNTPVNPVLPGSYAVVGSGPETDDNGNYTTYLGFRNDVMDINAMDPMTELNQTRRIVMNPGAGTFQVLNNGHTAQPEPVYGTQTKPVVPVVINQSTAGAERFSFSEPVGGYDLGTHEKAMAALPGGLMPLVNTATMMQSPIDRPLDLTRDDIDDPADFYKNGVKPQWRFVHLQRLANPLLPWNAESNPYLTIDTIGSDLIVFNGVTGQDDDDANGGDDDDAFETLQRGDPSNGAPPMAAVRQLWKRSTAQTLKDPTVGAAPEADAEHYAGYKLHHTLGYVNSSYQFPFAAAAGPDAQPGDLNVDATNPTFPWLQWNNRPFNSVYELMEVPMTSSSQLTRLFEVAAPNLTNPYTQRQSDLTDPDAAGTHQFGHLFNFYYAPATPPNDEVHSLYRIFDYLRVPSKFVESDTMLTATNFVNGTLAENPFHPPFNWLSNYRDPGMININTIFSKNVWNAVLGGDPAGMGAGYGLGPTFDDMVRSRRGYGSTGEILENNNAIPTEFAGAFRAAGTGDMNLSTVDPVEMTMLRKYPTTGIDTTKQNLPLFGNNHQNVHNNSARHPYFRHQTLHRLSNTLTTRSNVYACWVTIGYFEVDSSGQVGQELHADTGEIKRHRAFYMIDRSIPVGFEPGENHNVDRAILVRRYIE